MIADFCDRKKLAGASELFVGEGGMCAGGRRGRGNGEDFAVVEQEGWGESRVAVVGPI